MPSSHDLLVTTDFSIEGIHFRRDWHSPESVGHRCLTRGLSDIAAMGGEPTAAFLSLAVPPELPQSWVNRFMRGLIHLGTRYGVVLAGGDTSQSPDGILADIVLIGKIPTGEALLRSGARVGDGIYVTGALGESNAAISSLRQHPKRKLNPRDYPRHFFPEPRVNVARVLRKKKLASAMIDVSDGLSTDLSHICKESGVGAEVESNLIPVATAGRPPHPVNLDLALHGGEDYELLFTAPPRTHVPSRIAGVPISQIGRITREKSLVLKDLDGIAQNLQPSGWEHFRR